MRQEPCAGGDLGDLVPYAPGLRVFSGSRDRGGDMVLSFAEIREVLLTPAGRADPVVLLA
jgi:hypothetical protein